MNKKKDTSFLARKNVPWLIFSVSRDEIGAIQKFLIFQNLVGIGNDLPCEKAETKSFQMWGVTCSYF